MRKSLVRRVSEGIGLIGTLGIMALAGCKFPGPDPNPTPNPPSPPTQSSIDFSEVNSDLSNMNEEQTYTRSHNLLSIDKNGNPVVYKSVASPDGETSPILDSTNYTLTVTGNQNKTGNFKVNIEYNDNGKSVVTTLNGYLYNLLDVSGQLQGMNNHNGEFGIIRIYDSNKKSLTDVNGNPLLIQTDSNGNFNNIRVYSSAGQPIRADPNSLTSIILEAGAGSYVPTSDGIRHDNSAHDSYIRKVYLTSLKGDISQIIRTAPYVDVNGDTFIGTYQNNGDAIFNADGLVVSHTPAGIRSEIDDYAVHVKDFGASIIKPSISNIEVLAQGLDLSTFTSGTPGDDISTIETKVNEWNSIIKTSNNIRQGLNLPIQEDNSSTTNIHYQPIPGQGQIVPDTGWVIIVPAKAKNSLPSGTGGETFNFGQNGVYTGAVIYLANTSSGSVSHELGRALGFGANYDMILGQAYSLMFQTVNVQTGPLNSDKEDMQEFWEETFAEESLDNINGLSFD